MVSRFSGFRGLGFLLLIGSGVSESLGLVWGVPAYFVLPALAAQCRAMVWDVGPLY